jgi:hypothetical protein
MLQYVADAMHAESISTSHCIATDATGAPVRAPRECHLWHVFVFISDRGHVKRIGGISVSGTTDHLVSDLA